MKLKTSIAFAVWFVAVFSALGQGSVHSTVTAPNPLNYRQPPDQRAIDQANYQWQQQQAAIAAQKAAEQEAAKKAEYDAAVKKLANEETDAIAKLNAKYSPVIADLESQASIPKQKIEQLKQNAAELERQKSQMEIENAHLRAKQLFQPKDPWRLLDGKICNAKDQSWVQFTGQMANRLAAERMPSAALIWCWAEVLREELVAPLATAERLSATTMVTRSSTRAARVSRAASARRPLGRNNEPGDATSDAATCAVCEKRLTGMSNRRYFTF